MHSETESKRGRNVLILESFEVVFVGVITATCVPTQTYTSPRHGPITSNSIHKHRDNQDIQYQHIFFKILSPAIIVVIKF